MARAGQDKVSRQISKEKGFSLMCP